jgi:hypothetical protein
MNAEGVHQLQPRVDARSAATLGNEQHGIATLKGLSKAAAPTGVELAKVRDVRSGIYFATLSGLGTVLF